MFDIEALLIGRTASYKAHCTAPRASRLHGLLPDLVSMACISPRLAASTLPLHRAHFTQPPVLASDSRDLRTIPYSRVCGVTFSTKGRTSTSGLRVAFPANDYNVALDVRTLVGCACIKCIENDMQVLNGLCDAKVNCCSPSCVEAKQQA